MALGYNYVNYNGEAVYIEGIKSVLTVSDTDMTFRLPRGVLYVEGVGLTVSDLEGASILVRGQILSVATIPSEKRKHGKKEKTENGNG